MTDPTTHPADEEWRPVVGWEGLYEVSSLGRVRSKTRVRRVKGGHKQTWHGRELRLKRARHGYMVAHLSDLPHRMDALVHRLVLRAFVGEPPDGHEASHINGNRADNRACNLVWETRAANHSRKAEHGTAQVRERAPSAKLTQGGIDWARRERASGASWKDLAQELGVTADHLSAAVRGRKGTWK